MEFRLDISSYPPFIGLQWIMEQYHMTRPTVIRRIQEGFLPPFQSELGSSRSGWSREYFVTWQIEKARRDAAVGVAIN